MLPPVRDHAGHIVWRVRVAPNEMTCLACGDVAMQGRCVRCSMTDDAEIAASTPLVPTLSYLQDGEWER